jgi:pyruvate dehydrogenase E1 component alpha subunit
VASKVPAPGLLGEVRPGPADVPLRRLLGDGQGVAGVELPRLAPEMLKKAFRTMLLVRTLDAKLTNLQRQGRIGFYGACTGQEATPIGTAMAIREDDWLFPALREGSAALYRGFKLSHYVAQCLGNDHDLQRGRQMPCHYADRGINHVSWSSVIATQLPHAAGCAYGMKLKGRDSIAIGFLGDGATSENDFHSALNFAAVTKSPVIFVCQNNQFAISVQHDHQTATKTYAEKAIAYGMPGVRVDGNDVLAVHQAISEAAERARRGEGPTLVEALTYRLVPHSTSDDPTRYRDEAEYQHWLKRDPVEIFRRHLQARKIWSKEWEQHLQAELDAEVELAIKEAETAALPGPETMMDDVYASVPQLLEDEREVLLDSIQRGSYEWPPKGH